MREIHCVKVFLPAAKPTGQGTESVDCSCWWWWCDHFNFACLLMHAQKGCEKKKNIFKNRCEKEKLCSKKVCSGFYLNYSCVKDKKTSLVTQPYVNAAGQ